MFLSSESQKAVASNQDDTIELTMFRQNGSQSGAASGPETLVEFPPEEPGLTERGEIPPLREVRAAGWLDNSTGSETDPKERRRYAGGLYL